MKMKYRTNHRTGDEISEIGLGSSGIYAAGTDSAVKALQRAAEGGINYFDLAAGDGAAFPMYGEALHDFRKHIFYQIHFGADYSAGTYGWSLDPDVIKRSVEWQLSSCGRIISITVLSTARMSFPIGKPIRKTES